MIRRLLLLAFLLAAPAAMAQNGSFQDFCKAGNVLANVSGITSSNPLMGTYPRCQVDVFITGSSTHATIFSTVTGTPLANPFCANADASFLFFASQSAQYDVTISNSVACNPSPTFPQLPATFTWADAAVSGTGGGGGGSSVSLRTNGVVNVNQAILDITQGAGIGVSNSLGVTTFVNTGVLSFTGGAGGARAGNLTALATDYGAVGWQQTSGTFIEWLCLVTSTCDFTNFQVIGGPGTGAMLRLFPGTATGQSLLLEDFSGGNPKNALTAGGSGTPVNGWQLFTNVSGTGTYQSWSQTDVVLKSGATTLADFNSTLTTLNVPVSLLSTLAVTGNTTVQNLTISGTCTGCSSSGISTVTGTPNQISVTGGANPVFSIPTTFVISNEQQTQFANGNTVLQQSRFTDSSPSGLFLLGRATGGSTVYSVDVLGNGLFNSLATSNSTTAGYVGMEQGPDPLTACQAAAPSNVICLFAPTTISAEYGIGLPGTGPSSANGSILLFPALAGSESLTSFMALSGSTAANVACGTASLAGMGNGILAAGDGNGCLKSSGVNVSTVLPSIKGPGSAFTTTSLTAVSVYTYTSSIAGATTVTVDCSGSYKFTGTVENAAFDLNFSSVPTSIFLNVEIGSNATTGTHTYGRQTVNGSLVTSTVTAAATGTYYPVWIHGLVTTNASTTFDFQAATSNAAGTINIDANSIVCSVK